MKRSSSAPSLPAGQGSVTLPEPDATASPSTEAATSRHQGPPAIRQRTAEVRPLRRTAEGQSASASGRGRLDEIPRPVRACRPIGRVRFVVDKDEVTEVVGVVYGLEHEIVASGYRVKLFLDSYNRRIKVLEYQTTDYDAMVLKMRFLAEANRFDKIWLKATEADWQQFLRHGYVLEGVLKYFNRGKPAYLVSKFRSQRRLQSKHLMDETILIERIMAGTRAVEPRPLPPGYSLDFARERDIDGMLELYRQVFATYPSPLTYREYLVSVFQRDALFRVVRKGERVVAVASAELDRPHLAAELTDCATHTEERGKGLMSIILRALEGDLRRRGYRCAFSIARARSHGINAAFHALGYEFNGRLVNNCDIHGAFEDMNVWVRDLQPHGSRQRRSASKGGASAHASR